MSQKMTCLSLIAFLSTHQCRYFHIHSITLIPLTILTRLVIYFLQIIIEPQGYDVGVLNCNHLPKNCIPISPVTTKNFILTGLNPGTVLYDGDSSTGTQVTCKRTAFPLDGALAVTDYYAQG